MTRQGPGDLGYVNYGEKAAGQIGRGEGLVPGRRTVARAPCDPRVLIAHGACPSRPLRSRHVCRHRLGMRRRPAAPALADRRRGHSAPVHIGVSADQAAAGPSALRVARRVRHRLAGCDESRHELRLRLSRRRALTVRGGDAGKCVRPRVSGAAAYPDYQRVDSAFILLANLAGPRPGVLEGTRALHGDRRGQRDRGGGQRLYRHDRSTAVDPTLLGAARPERPLPGDELRHGNHRRHGPGALCVHPARTRSPMRRDIS